MINLNDYYLHPLKGKYIVPGIQLLEYWVYPDHNKLSPHIVTVTKVHKHFGVVMGYEYSDDNNGGRGSCSGGIDAVIQVVPLEK